MEFFLNDKKINYQECTVRKEHSYNGYSIDFNRIIIPKFVYFDECVRAKIVFGENDLYEGIPFFSFSGLGIRFTSGVIHENVSCYIEVKK